MKDFYQPCYTGQAPDYARTNYTETPKSIQEKIEMWYITPLRRMSGHEGFICLEVCFLLYEKFLRKALHLEGATFSDTHPVFNEIGGHFRVSREIAYEFWSHWRNGLLHRAMPATAEGRTYWMTSRQDEPIAVSGTHVSINPWRIRDIVLELVEANRRIWTDADFPLAKELKEL